MSDQPQILTAEEVAGMRHYSPHVDLNDSPSLASLCDSHEAQRQLVAELLTWVGDQEADSRKGSGSYCEGRCVALQEVLAEAARLGLTRDRADAQTGERETT